MTLAGAIKVAILVEFDCEKYPDILSVLLFQVINNIHDINLKMFVLNVAFPLCLVLGLVYGDPIISDSEILEWEAPEYLKAKFPYYLSGYDYDGSPVFVFEAGKWDIRSVVERPEAKVELDNWITQIMFRIRAAGNQAPDSPGAVLIADIEGMGMSQLGHAGVLEFMLKQFPKFHQLTKLPGIKRVYIINAHFLYKRVFEMGKPMLGEAANLIELYGTNAAKWKPALLKEIPSTELPAWYGGSESHRPIQVFG